MGKDQYTVAHHAMFESSDDDIMVHTLAINGTIRMDELMGELARQDAPDELTLENVRIKWRANGSIEAIEEREENRRQRECPAEGDVEHPDGNLRGLGSSDQERAMMGEDERTIKDFQRDNVWRDDRGTIWVRQNEAIQMQADAWDLARDAAQTEGNPYRGIWT